MNFYRGLLYEPGSEELKKVCATARDKLPPFGKRAYKYQLQAKVINLYLQRKSTDLCLDMGVSYLDVRKVVEEAIQSNSTSTMFETSELLRDCKAKDRASIYHAVCLILIDFERGDLGAPLAKEALGLTPDNTSLMISLALALIRQSK